MAALNTETLTLRVSLAVKDALRAGAGRERRSLANMLEVMILTYRAAEATPAPSEREQHQPLAHQDTEE
jgi:hypothetical protein